MSYVRIWIHCVWGTKKRTPFLIGDKKDEILSHIKTNAKTKNIYIGSLNGHLEHVHCLISLNADQSLAGVMQLIKGESSYWINHNSIINSKFEWADEYFAVSVSESQLQKVRNYIKNQDEHHRTKTWQEEYDEFIKKYGFTSHEG